MYFCIQYLYNPHSCILHNAFQTRGHHTLHKCALKQARIWQSLKMGSESLQHADHLLMKAVDVELTLEELDELEANPLIQLPA